MELLGASFDIHGGGLDLQFPHHENEIAQSKCCANPDAGFAQVWMHNEMLQVEGKKMSKSLGNFFTVRDLLDKGVPGEVIRFVYLGTHYRKPMDWTEEKAKQAETTLHKIANFLSEDPLSKPWVDLRMVTPPQDVVEALSNDLNTSLALTHVSRYLNERDEYSLVGALELLGFNRAHLKAEFSSFSFHAFADEVGAGFSVRSLSSSDDFQDLIAELGNKLQHLRTVAMASKDFSDIDALKAALTAAGVEVRMGKDEVELLPGPGFDAAKLEALK